jgi:ankyrin repeat protein
MYARSKNLVRVAGAFASIASLVSAAGAFGQNQNPGAPAAPPAGGPPPAAQNGPPPGDPLGPDLFMAIGKRDSATVKALLAKGAKPDGRNWLNMTPLMWAAATGNTAACADLLAAGANIDASCQFGTSLSFAEMGGSRETLRFLIDKGAKLTDDRVDGITPIMTAAETGRVEVIRMLLAQFKPDVNAQDVDGSTALIFAARRGQTAAARALLDVGAKADLTDSHGRTALMYAALNGYPATAQLLMGRGAAVNARDKAGNTALTLAARYAGSPDVLRALLKGGADKTAKDAKGRTALDIALARQNAAAVSAIRPGGAARLVKHEQADPLPQRARTAAQTSITLIEKATAKFASQAACMSCHHQGVGLMATGMAKERGFKYDKLFASSQLDGMKKQDEAIAKEINAVVSVPEMQKMVPGMDIDEFVPGLIFLYSGLEAHGVKPGPTQQAATVILANQQKADGHWGFLLHREPMQSSQFATTALAVRLVKAYLPEDRAKEAAERVAKAKAWLIATPAVTNEDRVYRLLGLKWAGADASEIKKAVAALRAAQRPDGGWAQFSTMPAADGSDGAYFRSDAYATGQALYALHMGGDVPTWAEPYRRGVEYLLRTQDDDGSWLVTKRAVPVNTYMDGGFPHGESQYISYGATCWASMALMLAAKPDVPADAPVQTARAARR